MSFFIAPRGEPGLDLVAERISTYPEFEDRFRAIKELRENQDLNEANRKITRNDGWVRVASFVGPVLDLAEVLTPDFLAEKKNFYRFLDEHKEYCTYDRRKPGLGDGLFHGWRPDGELT